MTDTMLRPPKRRAGERTRFWQVRLSLRVDGHPEDAEALAQAIAGYPDIRLERVEQNPLAGVFTITMTLPAFDAVHAVTRATHVARECAIAADRSLPEAVRVSSGPGRRSPSA